MSKKIINSKNAPAPIDLTVRLCKQVIFFLFQGKLLLTLQPVSSKLQVLKNKPNR